MIALAGLQLVEFARGRRWAPLLIGYLVFLIAFYVRVARHSAGAWGPGWLGFLALALGTAWTLPAGQDPGRWQVLVVSAGSPERARLSRVLLSVAVLTPLALLTVLVADAGRFDGSAAAGFGQFLLYEVAAGVGSIIGTLAGRRATARSVGPAGVLVGLVLITVLLRS